MGEDRGHGLSRKVKPTGKQTAQTPREVCCLKGHGVAVLLVEFLSSGLVNTIGLIMMRYPHGGAGKNRAPRMGAKRLFKGQSPRAKEKEGSKPSRA